MLNTGTATLRFETEDQIAAKILQLNEGGLTVHLEGPVPQGNHTWVRFALPGRRGDCLALGTILERTESMIRIQFKHLFPDQARTLAKALNQPRISRPSFSAQVA